MASLNEKWKHAQTKPIKLNMIWNPNGEWDPIANVIHVHKYNLIWNICNILYIWNILGIWKISYWRACAAYRKTTEWLTYINQAGSNTDYLYTMAQISRWDILCSKWPFNRLTWCPSQVSRRFYGICSCQYLSKVVQGSRIIGGQSLLKNDRKKDFIILVILKDTDS